MGRVGRLWWGPLTILGKEKERKTEKKRRIEEKKVTIIRRRKLEMTMKIKGNRR